MIFYCAFVIFCLIGSFGAHQADIDINRLQPLQKEPEHFYYSPYYVNGRRSASFDQIQRSHDYDDYRGGISEQVPSLRFVYASPTSYPKKTVKIHQPREDPRLFYQSDAYFKEINKDIDHRAISIFPEREVIRHSKIRNPIVLPRKARNKENRIYPEFEQCIRCPRDRTLVSSAGSDRIVLQAPRLVNCAGHPASNKVKFIHMYGPRFGSYVTGGSHVVVGRIKLDGKSLQLCKMEVHVIVQSCPVPKYLVPRCDQFNRTCNFTCRDSRLQIIGETSVVCGDDMEWENDLPVCRARSWCHSPIPPEQGRISCKGNYIDGGTGLEEGSKCRIKCASEWRPVSRGVTVCRRGVWTHNLQCQPRSRHARR